MNRLSNFLVPTSFRNYQSQELCQKERSCTKHLSRFTPLLMLRLQRLRRHRHRDLETVPYPHAVPLKSDGIAPFGASQLVPGSGEGQNTLKPQEYDSCMKGAGRSSNQSSVMPGHKAYRPIRVPRRMVLFCTVVVQARPMWLQLEHTAASVPSSFMPLPRTYPG